MKEKKFDKRLVSFLGIILLLVILFLVQLPKQNNAVTMVDTSVTQERDLSEFIQATEVGLQWDCNKSSFNGRQVITLSGPSLRFVCMDGIVYVDFIDENEIAVDAGLGNDDYFVIAK